MKTIPVFALALVIGTVALASTHVGNRSIAAGVHLPAGWSISFNNSATPSLSTQACGTQTWTEATPYAPGGTFLGWQVTAGSTCAWEFDMEGPRTVTLSNGAGVTVITSIDPAPAGGTLNPDVVFPSDVGTPEVKLWVGDEEMFEEAFEGLSSGTYSPQPGDPLADEIEAVFEEVSFELL